jgi:hypothetical protein
VCIRAQKDLSVETQPNFDDKKIKAVLMEKDKQTQALTTKKGSKVEAVNSQSKVRHISIYTVFLTQTSLEL